MSQETLYTIRDTSGGTYGPANMALLRQWIAEGRIDPEMELAVHGTTEFLRAGDFPELADALGLTPPPAAPADPEKLYMLRYKFGGTWGPVKIDELRAWVADGRLTPEMQLAPFGTNDYAAAGSLPDLAEAFSPPPPPPAPPHNPHAPMVYASYEGQYTGSATTNGLAIVSLIAAIASVLVCLPICIFAIIFGHMALREIGREPHRYSGRGLAVAGLVIGYILLVLFVVVLMLVVSDL